MYIQIQKSLGLDIEHPECYFGAMDQNDLFCLNKNPQQIAGGFCLKN